MKTTIPERTVEVCDFCQREGYLTKCWICDRQYCLTDNGVIPASYGFTDICRECARRKDVQTICDCYAAQMKPIFDKRRAALKRLHKREKEYARI